MWLSYEVFVGLLLFDLRDGQLIGDVSPFAVNSCQLEVVARLVRWIPSTTIDTELHIESVQLAVLARDPFWHEVLYGTLIELGAVRELLELDGRAPGLEAYLRSHGGLTGAVPGVPIGPLSSKQACSVSHGSGAAGYGLDF